MQKLLKILIFINLFFLQSYLLRFDIFSYPSNLQEVFIGLVAGIFLVNIIAKKHFWQTVKNIKNHWIIWSFVVLTGLSIALVPIENNLDFLRHIKFLFFAGVLTFMFLESFNEKERIEGLKIAGYGAIAFGIFSAIYNLAGYNVAADLRLLGPLDAAVYLAYYFAPFFLFFLMRFFEKRDKKDLFAAILLGVMLIFTRSMGAIGGSFLVILLYFFTRSHLKILQSKTVKIALVGIFLIISAAAFYTKILPTIQTQWSSLDERGEIWQTSAHLLKEPRNLLFGVGFGQFEHQYIKNVDQVLGRPPLDYYVIQPHNIFLLFTFHYGILGLALLIFIMTKTALNIYNQPKNIDTKTLASFILIYFFVHGLIDTPFFKNDILILLMIFLESALVKTRNQIA